MSLQWGLIAGFLYTEIAIIALMLLPIVSPQRWQKIFRSRLLNALSAQASVYFTVVLGILALFLLDAIREIRKYSDVSQHDKNSHAHLDAEMQANMRLFRAQRNLYISGFSLFLCFVIRRLATLISAQATLLAENEAAIKQAKSATTTARNLMTEKRGSGEESQNSSNEASANRELISKLEKEVKEKDKIIQEQKEQLAKKDKDHKALLSQQEGIAREYDRLTDEHAKLHKLLDASDKKSD